MQNSAFLNQLKMHFRDSGCNGRLQIRLPKPRYAHGVDCVVSGEGISDVVSAKLKEYTAVESSEYIEQARVVNIRFAERALYTAIADWDSKPPLPRHILLPDRKDTHWENPFYAVHYAHYRAGCVAADLLHWDYDKEAARKLAVALILFQEDMENCQEPRAFMMALADLAKVYAHWHESLLLYRAAKIRNASYGLGNGDLTQKEAIQYPISGALLARATAISLQNGLHLLTINPTKDWVA